MGRGRYRNTERYWNAGKIHSAMKLWHAQIAKRILPTDITG
jgi:hypothetical protein